MQRIVINRFLFGLSLVATVALLFNMTLIPIFKHDVLDKSAHITIIEIILLFCFSTVFIFNAFCFFWGCRKRKKDTDSVFCTFIMMASVLCIIMIFGQKTMIDELARQYQLHWESNGEWAVLYLFFTIQLIFNSVVILKLRKRIQAV